MDEKSLFMNFWTKESTTTRNVIARIPEGSDYRPDPKSRTAHEGQRRLWPGVSSSTSSTTAGRLPPTCGQWGRLCRKSTGRAETNRSGSRETCNARDSPSRAVIKALDGYRPRDG